MAMFAPKCSNMKKLFQSVLVAPRVYASTGGGARLETEPKSPRVATPVPGPKSLAVINELNAFQYAKTNVFAGDYARSAGNYICDADGNLLMDLFGQIASLPIGYNHPDLVRLAQTPEYINCSINRPSLGYFPPSDWPIRMRNTLGRVAPRGLDRHFTMMCGSCAVENAIKTVFIERAGRTRRDAAAASSSPPPPTQTELHASALRNQPPGSPHYSVISFENGFHGRLLGSLSMSRSNALHKLDIPAFDWPAAPFPPRDATREQERACLERVEQIIRGDDGSAQHQKQQHEVAAVIVEPIQSEGGDNHASAEFFRGLQALCRAHNVAFIVDEVQTGVGATGTFWAHEQWGLVEPPDIVVFSKKMLLGGYFCSERFMPDAPFRIFNTWLGDPAKIMQLETVLDVIERDDLLAKTRHAGQVLLDGLKKLQTRYPDQIFDSRGVGTFCAIDAQDVNARNDLLHRLRQVGFHLGGCATRGIRFRPALIFEASHAQQFLDAFDKVLVSM